MKGGERRRLERIGDKVSAHVGVEGVTQHPISVLVTDRAQVCDRVTDFEIGDVDVQTAFRLP